MTYKSVDEILLNDSIQLVSGPAAFAVDHQHFRAAGPCDQMHIFSYCEHCGLALHLHLTSSSCVNNDLNGSLRINSRLHARLNNLLSHPIPSQRVKSV